MEHYISGDVNSERMFDVIGGALDVLRRDGFEAQEAMAAWDAVTSVALGSAVSDLREREAVEAGRPWLAQLHATVARRDPAELPTLRELLETRLDADREVAFEERLTSMIVGLATRFGRPIDDDVLGRPAAASRRTDAGKR
jgi:hypothetical protein